MSEHLCEFCKKIQVAETHMICDKCFEDEIKANERQEEIDNYWNEQQRIRYAQTAIFDNEIGKISVSYHRKIIRTWHYNFFNHMDEDTRYKSKIEARAYLEGWLDCMESIRIAIKKGLRK